MFWILDALDFPRFRARLDIFKTNNNLSLVCGIEIKYQSLLYMQYSVLVKCTARIINTYAAVLGLIFIYN